MAAVNPSLTVGSSSTGLVNDFGGTALKITAIVAAVAAAVFLAYALKASIAVRVIVGISVTVISLGTWAILRSRGGGNPTATAQAVNSSAQGIKQPQKDGAQRAKSPVPDAPDAPPPPPEVMLKKLKLPAKTDARQGLLDEIRKKKKSKIDLTKIQESCGDKTGKVLSAKEAAAKKADPKANSSTNSPAKAPTKAKAPNPMAAAIASVKLKPAGVAGKPTGAVAKPAAAKK